MGMKWPVRVINSCVRFCLSYAQVSETCAILFSSNFLSYHLPMEQENRGSIGLEVCYRVYLGHWKVPGLMQLYWSGKGVSCLRQVTITGRESTH